MRNQIVLCMAIAVIFSNGCGLKDDEDKARDYGIQPYSETGVVPDAGSFSFDQRGTFTVQDVGGIRSLRFSSDGSRFDTISITNGAFMFTWGEIGGTNCPSDGYSVAGHFTSATTAEGSIEYASNCQRTGGGNFTAVKN